MKYYLGVDIGTTSAKAVAFSKKGEELKSCSRTYEMCHPRSGWSEQDPDEIVKAVVESIHSLVQDLSPQMPVFISFSAAMHSLILLDVRENPLTACMIWADNRAEEIAERLKQHQDGMKFYKKTGVPIHAMSPFCKILWFKENEPEVFKSADRFIGIKEYVFLKLFDERIIDTSLASATGMLNLHTLDWDPEILHFLGINTSNLFRVVSTQHVLQEKKNASSLTRMGDTAIITGASDGASASLATSFDLDSLAISIGTSGAVRMLVNSPHTDGGMKTFCYHVKENLFISGGATNNGGLVLQWLKESIFKTAEDYDQLMDDAMKVEASADELFCLPYISGERAPIWNSKVRAVFFGLGIEHQQPHLVRAAIEGIIFCLYSIALPLLDQKQISRVYLSGGLARNLNYGQLLADVFNREVRIAPTVESSALGAVLLGMEALDLSLDLSSTPQHIFLPSAGKSQLYAQAFKKWNRIYESVKWEWEPSS